MMKQNNLVKISMITVLGFIALTVTFGQKKGNYNSFKATDPNIIVMGRTQLTDAGEIEFDWPGTTITARFKGTSCAIKLDDSMRNFYNIFLDGELLFVAEIRSDTVLKIASGLKNEEHLLEITKRTEGSQGIGSFKGLLIDKNGKLLSPPPARERKIEFIGNSITCGYGSEATVRNAPFHPEEENNYKSYAAIMSRAFDADYHIIAHSGQGVVRNYGEKQRTSEYTMKDRYLQTYDTWEKPLWDFSKWKPDMVVINLGTNDFSTRPMPYEEDFKAGYNELIDSVHAKYGVVPIFCIVGPMINEPCYSFVKWVVEERRVMGNERDIYFIGIPPYLMEEEDWGAHHPNYSGHIKMANHLIPTISAVMDWDYGEIR